MARQVAQPLFLSCPWSLSKPRGASRRATQTSLRRLGLFAGVFLTAPGRAFRWPSISDTAIRQPAPGRRLILATGRSPGAARVRAVRQHTRGRRIRLHHQTPLDDAPRLNRTDRTIFTIGLKSTPPCRPGRASARPGTHTPQSLDWSRCMDPRLRGDDGRAGPPGTEVVLTPG
jgi:hypothetical protein